MILVGLSEDFTMAGFAGMHVSHVAVLMVSRVDEWKFLGHVGGRGSVVRHFVDPAVELAFKLVKSVDEWLVRNP